MDEQDEVNYCELVAQRVEQQTGYPDAEDLCFQLLEQAVIPETATVEEGARKVIEHLGA